MKTQDELFAQFQKEFEKKRKRGLIGVLFNLLFSLLFIVGMLAMEYLIVLIYLQERLSAPAKSLFWLIFFTVVIVFIICMAIWITISAYTDKYNIKKLLKEKQDYLQKQIELRNENWGFRDIITVPNIRPFKCIYDEKSITIWIMLARRYGVDHDFQVLAKIDDEISKQCNEIQETEVWIQVYKHANEKNFWQYLRSGKWHKKIN